MGCVLLEENILNNFSMTYSVSRPDFNQAIQDIRIILDMSRILYSKKKKLFMLLVIIKK